jgi:hypothetical protein
LDDFQVVAERRRVMAALTALTDQYRELNQELQRRESLRWMLARLARKGRAVRAVRRGR